MGTSPAVLTETVWALCHQKKPVVPDEIVVLVTKSGKERLCEEVLSGEKPVWEQMLTALSELRKKLQYVGFANAETLVPQRGNPVTFPMGKNCDKMIIAKRTTEVRWFMVGGELKHDRKRNLKRIVQRTVARISWRSNHTPMRVAEWKTAIEEKMPENFKNVLPTIEQIESEFSGADATDFVTRSARSAKQRKNRRKRK